MVNKTTSYYVLLCGACVCSSLVAALVIIYGWVPLALPWAPPARLAAQRNARRSQCMLKHVQAAARTYRKHARKHTTTHKTMLGRDRLHQNG